jgi:hypothetical protein
MRQMAYALLVHDICHLDRMTAVTPLPLAFPVDRLFDSLDHAVRLN